MGAPSDHNPDISHRDLADISARADGTLEPARHAGVDERIAASPTLQALYEQERRVVALLDAARRTTRAPVSLRARIGAERERAARRPRGLPIRPVYGGALAAALAVVALAIVLVAPAGTPGAPSVSQAASLASRGPAAPAPDPRNPVKLGRSVEDVYFPNWSRLHWRAVGQRQDRISGRQASTVYYQWRGRQIAYTIVSAPALEQPTARVTERNGTTLRTLTIDGRLVVTWQRSGHTCVLSGSGVPTEVMQALAAWTAPGFGRG
jgi:anti-sigma factor RsiW